MIHPSKGLRKVIDVTQEDVDKFLSIINIDSQASSTFDMVDDSNTFYGMFPDIKKLMGIELSKEVFYAVKTGYTLKGVPARLVYIISTAFKTLGVDNVNNTLNSIVAYLKDFVDYTYSENNLTVKDIIENIIGKPVSLLTDDTRMVRCNNYYEVWISDVEQVAFIPEDIAESLSPSNIEAIKFDANKGLVLKDIILRTFNGRLGVTKDDLDLRDCL